MFAAVRNHFRRWDAIASTALTGRRARRLAALFLFEFVVVLLGVLAAQMVQEHAADSRAKKDADSAIERAAREAASFRATAEYWLKAGPCLARQMDEAMRSAALGEELPNSMRRPRIPLSAFTPWSEATTIAARRAYGEELVNDYFGLQVMAAKMADDSHELAGEWALLGLLDPALGPVAREDRLNARVAAGRIKGRIASIRVTARNAVSVAERRSVSADPARSRLLTLPEGCEPRTR